MTRITIIAILISLYFTTVLTFSTVKPAKNHTNAQTDFVDTSGKMKRYVAKKSASSINFTTEDPSKQSSTSPHEEENNRLIDEAHGSVNDNESSTISSNLSLYNDDSTITPILFNATEVEDDEFVEKLIETSTTSDSSVDGSTIYFDEASFSVGQTPESTESNTSLLDTTTNYESTSHTTTETTEVTDATEMVISMQDDVFIDATTTSTDETTTVISSSITSESHTEIADPPTSTTYLLPSTLSSYNDPTTSSSSFGNSENNEENLRKTETETIEVENDFTEKLLESTTQIETSTQDDSFIDVSTIYPVEVVISDSQSTSTLDLSTESRVTDSSFSLPFLSSSDDDSTTTTYPSHAMTESYETTETSLIFDKTEEPKDYHDNNNVIMQGKNDEEIMRNWGKNFNNVQNRYNNESLSTTSSSEPNVNGELVQKSHDLGLNIMIGSDEPSTVNITSSEGSIHRMIADYNGRIHVNITIFTENSSTRGQTSIQTTSVPDEFSSSLNAGTSQWPNESESKIATTIVSNETNDSSCSSSPSVVPEPIVLILEGGRTFPAKTFPPNGTTFARITLGHELTEKIPAYSYWNMQFYQLEASHMRFDCNIPGGASIGVYARRNAPPTLTQFDLFEVHSGFKARTTIASHSSIKKKITHYMESGLWFLSLYNDDSHRQKISFNAIIISDMKDNYCPNDCSGNGECVNGHCQCNRGYGGDDCTDIVYPILCNDHGEYINGECHCIAGWKGKECTFRYDECEIADCNGRGHCANGKCNCIVGYKGKFCDKLDCAHPTCSEHGYCVEGECICRKGWQGDDCSETEYDIQMPQDAPAECYNHGYFDTESQTCHCDPMWSGVDCSEELCDVKCGAHGHCSANTCVCSAGWSGELCDMQNCDVRCNEHGQCKNGTCLCLPGWNGRHCTLEGCPYACSNNGECRVDDVDNQWQCHCYNGWAGIDCSVLQEQNCNDGRDNDNDGLIDCADPECCSNELCRGSNSCLFAPEPIDILLRKQPTITASFSGQMNFLIEDNSVQLYAYKEAFNDSRSAVVRGRVITSIGSNLMGVRVCTNKKNEGFTMTRNDGWFDLLVNGGGPVTLHFGRSSFKAQTQTIFVPWNEIVVVDEIVMTQHDIIIKHIPHVCTAHDYDLMKPIVSATLNQGVQTVCPKKSAILTDTKILHETLRIPDTDLHLVYDSSRTANYLSTIKLQLTPHEIPPSLALIHLRITIAGVLVEKIFESDPAINYTYIWNHLNIYRQPVYGIAKAMIKVGYEYKHCKDIIWTVQIVELSGRNMPMSEIGGWNLNIHHRYNIHEGIVQRGDGSNVYLRNKPQVLRTIMGDGHPRPLDCRDCNYGTAAYKQRILALAALAASADGSIYMIDSNLIRKILIDGTVRTLVTLNTTKVTYYYYIALSPNGALYIADSEAHRIIRVLDTNNYTDPVNNWEQIVGTGVKCLTDDNTQCGDGGLAKDAKLTYPKGIAIDVNDNLYIADGTTVRMVNADGIISTLIGDYKYKSHRKPIPCAGTLNNEEVHLHWPTALTLNPLDNSLYIIDDHLILRCTSDGRVKVVAGRPLHCRMSNYDTQLAIHTTLIMPQSMAFDATGKLYVAESDSARINRVRIIDKDGKIALFAGVESKCNCRENNCDCYETDDLALTSKFSSISAIIVTPDEIVHIGDQGNYRLRSIYTSIPIDGNGKYKINSPDTKEIYVFNRYGQHIKTKNALTGQNIYLFNYNTQLSNAKLLTITDAAGNKIILLRDRMGHVNFIENTKTQRYRLQMSRTQLLREFITPDNYNITFNYQGTTSLLIGKFDNTGRSFIYNYNDFGRLTSVVTPTGKIINLNDAKNKVEIVQKSRDSVRLITDSHTVITDLRTHGIFAKIDELNLVPVKQRTEIAGNLVNHIEWKYLVRKERESDRVPAEFGKKLIVNGNHLLSLLYDKKTNNLVISMHNDNQLFNVTYDDNARPRQWTPREFFATVHLQYDNYNRLIKWTWGNNSENYGFDSAGRLSEIRYSDNTALIYTFKNRYSSLPAEVITPGGGNYQLKYDKTGGLTSITTPRGSIHGFLLQTSLGFYKYQYYSSTNQLPHEIYYNDDGQILAKVYPHQSGKVVYVYDNAGKLETLIDGLSACFYYYDETNNLVRHIDIIEPTVTMIIEYKYNAGIVEREIIKFNAKNIVKAQYHYQYDGNARINAIEVVINGKKPFSPLQLDYNENLGVLEAIDDMRIYRTADRCVIKNNKSGQFFIIFNYDEYKRVKTVLMNIKSYDVFHMELEYDSRNRVSVRKIGIGIEEMDENDEWFDVENITYNADGNVQEVIGDDVHWQYNYDVNGNVIGVTEQNETIGMMYDDGDRIVQFGDTPKYNSYDSRGFLVTHGEYEYRYNARSQLIQAFKYNSFEISYHYDDRSRLVSRNDGENIIQYFYTNPMTPDLVSHVYLSRTNEILRLLYDTRDFLMIVETTEERFYVATDQIGSPLAIFNENGKIMKVVQRTPFGRIIEDSNPDFYLPIDFNGGIYDIDTELIYINKRFYNPTMGQWMTPAWEDISNKFTTPTAIHIYRFHNNDPINLSQNLHYMTDLTSWLKTYGYDINSILGSIYTKAMNYQPKVSINSRQLLLPNFDITSETECVVNRIHEKFSATDFIPKFTFERTPERHNLMQRIAHRHALFDEGILVSRVNGRALVRIIDGVNGILQNSTLILNNSYFLPLHTNVNDRDIFYFVKDDVLMMKNDTKKLKEFDGVLLNALTREGKSDRAGIERQLRLHNGIIVLKYGVDVKEEINKILQNAHERAVMRAWEIEKVLVNAGLQGRGNWTDEEINELIKHGIVDGYEGVNVHDGVYNYPLIADDPENIVFAKKRLP